MNRPGGMNGGVSFIPHPCCLRRAEALPVLNRGDEGFNHLGLHEVAAELVELPEPEVVAGEGRVGLPAEADGETVDTTELVVDELLSNAVRHADEQVEVTVIDEPTGTRVAVTDDDDRPPELAVMDGTSEYGRGTGIVASLADEVGVTPRPSGGKSVWARLRWRKARKD